MARILITGAGGYIGSKLAKDALSRGHELHLIDDFSKSQVDDIDGTRVERVDIREEQVVRKAVRDIDCAAHLAAISGVAAAVENPELAKEVNIQGTRNIVAACRSEGIPLVFASTFAVIGWPNLYPITEDHPCRPINDYGKAKLVAEEAVGEAANDIDAIIFRISNVYGTHRIGERLVRKESVVNKFIDLMLHERPLEVYAPGTQARDFIHVRDVSKAFLRGIEVVCSESCSGLVITNLASGHWIAVEELARLIVAEGQLAGFGGGEYNVVPNPRGKIEILPQRFDVDISRLTESLGFRPSQDLKSYVHTALSGDDVLQQHP